MSQLQNCYEYKKSSTPLWSLAWLIVAMFMRVLIWIQLYDHFGGCWAVLHYSVKCSWLVELRPSKSIDSTQLCLLWILGNLCRSKAWGILHSWLCRSTGRALLSCAFEHQLLWLDRHTLHKHFRKPRSLDVPEITSSLLVFFFLITTGHMPKSCSQINFSSHFTDLSGFSSIFTLVFTVILPPVWVLFTASVLATWALLCNQQKQLGINTSSVFTSLDCRAALLTNFLITYRTGLKQCSHANASVKNTSEKWKWQQKRFISWLQRRPFDQSLYSLEESFF